MLSTTQQHEHEYCHLQQVTPNILGKPHTKLGVAQQTPLLLCTQHAHVDHRFSGCGHTHACGSMLRLCRSNPSASARSLTGSACRESHRQQQRNTASVLRLHLSGCKANTTVLYKHGRDHAHLPNEQGRHTRRVISPHTACRTIHKPASHAHCNSQSNLLAAEWHRPHTHASRGCCDTQLPINTPHEQP